MQIAVIGAGMIGSAAARYLSEAGHEVTLIGPAEPESKSKHSGPFASHYDAGRITRKLATDPFWAQASIESIARYRDLETQSGISFYNEVGALMVGPEDSRFMADIAGIAATLQIDFQTLKNRELRERFPYFAFTPGDIGLYEPTSAGTIDPRRLVAAEILLARASGATLRREPVQQITEMADSVRIITPSDALKFDQVLVATGGFTTGLMPDIELAVYARTVAFFELSDTEVERLAHCPTMIYWHLDGRDPYFLPPLRYPDGKYYIKLGGDPNDRLLSPTEMTEWFQSGGDPDVRDVLEAQIRLRMPDLQIQSVSSDACVTTFTDNNRPLITRHSDRVSLAVAGCGAAAKCCDELGRLGAEVALGRDLPAWAR